MTIDPSPAAVDAWIRLNRLQQAMMAKISRAFREGGFPPYAWYDALWELEKAGESGLRPSDIERQLLISQSNVSRLIERMVAKGVAGRQECIEDGRGMIVAITDEGRALRREMWPVYAACIKELLDDGLNEGDRHHLGALLSKVENAQARN